MPAGPESGPEGRRNSRRTETPDSVNRNQEADGVWVRQSEWAWSNAIVVRGGGGLILVDPSIDGSDLKTLADDVDRLGIPVVAGFSTPSPLGPPALAFPVRRRAALRHPRRRGGCQ